MPPKWGCKLSKWPSTKYLQIYFSLKRIRTFIYKWTVVDAEQGQYRSIFRTFLKSVISNQSQCVGTIISIFNLNGHGITKQRFVACVDYYFWNVVLKAPAGRSSILTHIQALSVQRVSLMHKIKGNMTLNSFNPFYFMLNSNAVTPISIPITDSNIFLEIIPC